VCDGCQHLAYCVDRNYKPFTKNCKIHPKPYPQEIQRLKTNPKLDALEELIDGILAEERNKVIIWCYFREELRIVGGLLKEKGIEYLRLDGSNSSKGPEYSEKFNKDPNTRVWLAQISTGVALTLTAATYMIYFDLSYDLGAYLQSLDRNYRIGQQNAVTVYRLTCQGSVLEYVAAALAQKEDIASTLADSINCVFCKHGLNCLVDGVKPFEPGCVHKSRAARVITRPVKL
jgi:SNF2 family DNA or RNA helicase